MQGCIEEAMEEVRSQVLTLLFAIPLLVLKDHYWKRSDAKRMEEFTRRVLEIYEAYEAGEVTLEDIKQECRDKTGIALEKA